MQRVRSVTLSNSVWNVMRIGVGVPIGDVDGLGEGSPSCGVVVVGVGVVEAGCVDPAFDHRSPAAGGSDTARDSPACFDDRRSLSCS